MPLLKFIARLRDIFFQKDTRIVELTEENALLKAQLAEALAKDREDEVQVAAANATAAQARIEADEAKEQLAKEREELETTFSSFLEEVDPNSTSSDEVVTSEQVRIS